MPRHRVAGQLARSVLPLELRRVRVRAGARVRVRVRVKVRVRVGVRVGVGVRVRVRVRVARYYYLAPWATSLALSCDLKRRGVATW